MSAQDRVGRFLRVKAENGREVLERIERWAGWQFEEYWTDVSPWQVIAAYVACMADGVECPEDSPTARKILNIGEDAQPVD